MGFWPYVQAHRTWLKAEQESKPNERQLLLEAAAPYSSRARDALNNLRKAQEASIVEGRKRDDEKNQKLERDQQIAIDDARRKASDSQEIRDLTSAFWKAANALEVTHAEEKLARLRQLIPSELDALEVG